MSSLQLTGTVTIGVDAVDMEQARMRNDSFLANAKIVLVAVDAAYHQEEMSALRRQLTRNGYTLELIKLEPKASDSYLVHFNIVMIAEEDLEKKPA
jgi:predicted lipid-binding transport protein (Tim44 family)